MKIFEQLIELQPSEYGEWRESEFVREVDGIATD